MQFEHPGGTALHCPSKGSIECDQYSADSTEVEVTEEMSDGMAELLSSLLEQRSSDPVMFRTILSGDGQRCDCIHLSPPRSCAIPGTMTYIGGIEVPRRMLYYVH